MDKGSRVRRASYTPDWFVMKPEGWEGYAFCHPNGRRHTFTLHELDAQATDWEEVSEQKTPSKKNT